MTPDHVHISRCVSKLGADIPSVSLPPVVTCRTDAPCRSKCYARKGRWAFSRNKALLARNLAVWESAPESYASDVIAAAFHSRFFRWHSSGDIPDLEYLNMMVNVANSLQGTRFLCFTKKYELANEYLRIHNSFPANLRVVFSAWGSFIPDNPHNLPMSYVKLKCGDNSPIPSNAGRCPNYCGDCVMSGCSCWDLKNGESICFNEH